MKVFLAGSVLLLLFSTLPSYSHHSFPGLYDVDQQRLLEGVATKFLFRNPHTFILLNVKNEIGMSEQWYVEMAPLWVLVGRGINKDTIQPGDELMITCNPARDGGRSCGLGEKGGLYQATNQLLYGLDPRSLNHSANELEQ